MIPNEAPLSPGPGARAAPSAPWRYVVAPAAIALVLNALVAATGAFTWSAQLQSPSFAPPAGTIGAVWIVLFGLMGAALWRVGGGVAVRGIAMPRHTTAARAILAMIAVCAAFPLYALTPRSVFAGLLGTAVSLPLAWGVIALAARADRRAGLLMLPLGFFLALALPLAYTSWRLNS